MIILKPIATAQSVKFIPTREGNADKLVLRNETTNVATEIVIDIQCYCCSFYTEFEAVFNLEEGHFYMAEFKEGNNLVHRDKIFCTSQDVDTYTVNKDEYVVNNQDIIFYE